MIVPIVLHNPAFYFALLYLETLELRSCPAIPNVIQSSDCSFPTVCDVGVLVRSVCAGARDDSAT